MTELSGIVLGVWESEPSPYVGERGSKGGGRKGDGGEGVCGKVQALWQRS